MADAVVTARMSQSKKETGNRILRELGTTPSQFINSMYDFVIQEKRLPFAEKREMGMEAHTKEEWARALEFVRSIQLPAPNRFASMTDDEIRMERLRSKGLLDGLEDAIGEERIA